MSTLAVFFAGGVRGRGGDLPCDVLRYGYVGG